MVIDTHICYEYYVLLLEHTINAYKLSVIFVEYRGVGKLQNKVERLSFLSNDNVVA